MVADDPRQLRSVCFEALVVTKERMQPTQLLDLFSSACFNYWEANTAMAGYRLTVQGTAGELSQRFMLLAYFVFAGRRPFATEEFHRAIIEERVMVHSPGVLHRVIVTRTPYGAFQLLQQYFLNSENAAMFAASEAYMEQLENVEHESI